MLKICFLYYKKHKCLLTGIRTAVWKKLLADKIGNEKLRRLQLIGDTRWNSKDTAIKAIFHSINEEHDKRGRFTILLEILHIFGYNTSVNSIQQVKLEIF